jgi:ABC-type sulfate transport system substrate-binding protein
MPDPFGQRRLACAESIRHTRDRAVAGWDRINFCLYRKPIQTLSIGSSQSLANVAPTVRAIARLRRNTKSPSPRWLFTIDDFFGGWTKAQKEHFAEGGIFDQIYKN